MSGTSGKMAEPRKKGISDAGVAAIAYFTPIMPFFFLAIHRYNKRPYVRFHAWQSLLLNVFVSVFCCAVYFALPYFKFLGLHVLLSLLCVVGLAIFLIWLWCVMSALNGKRFRLPGIGNWADEQAYR